MRQFQEPRFERGEADGVYALAEQYKERGYTFININATTCEDGCEVLYVFREQAPGAQLQGTTVTVAPGQHLASITPLYPEAFVFENETHDLFGIPFDGISIDYGGEFYKVAVAYPMNPQAAQTAPAGAEGEEGGNE